jgi:hypothetical protein
MKVVPYFSAVVPGATNATDLMIHKNHSDMVKFESEQDEDYIQVARMLSLMSLKAKTKISQNWAADPCQ